MRALLSAFLVCPECGIAMYPGENRGFVAYHLGGEYSKCSNEGKAFAMPTFEVVEVPNHLDS